MTAWGFLRSDILYKKDRQQKETMTKLTHTKGVINEI